MPTAEDLNTLLALLRRTTDDAGWLQPLLDDPDSAAVVGAQIAIMARLGPAVIHNAAQATLSDASGGTPGAATITISRVSGGTTGTIPAGYVFRDARGVQAISQVAVAVLSGDLTKSIPVQTLRQTELINSEDDPVFAIDPTSQIVPASSGVLIAPPGSAGLSATSFQTVGPSTPITGGAADYLSVHGNERGIQRQPGEDTFSYRIRVRNIPDAVSPIAVADAVQAAAQRPGVPPLLVVEPFNDGATPALKTLHGLSSFDPLAWDADFYDDPLSGLVLVDRRTITAYFEIDAQAFVKDVDGVGVFYDDAFYDDPVLGYPNDVDLFPPTVLGGLLGVINDAQAKKAAGVNFDLRLKVSDAANAIGSTSANTFTLIWTLTPAAGTIWMLAELTVSHDTALPVPTAAHHVIFDLEGGGTMQSPDFSNTWSERVKLPFLRVTGVRGYLKTDGVNTGHLFGHAEYVAVRL